MSYSFAERDNLINPPNPFYEDFFLSSASFITWESAGFGQTNLSSCLAARGNFPANKNIDIHFAGRLSAIWRVSVFREKAHTPLAKVFRWKWYPISFIFSFLSTSTLLSKPTDGLLGSYQKVLKRSHIGKISSAKMTVKV